MESEPWSDDEHNTNPTGARVTAPMPVAFDASLGRSGARPRPVPPSPVVNNTKGRSRSDFEAILASNSDPSDEILRSAEYAEWYYSQNPRDPRALAPIVDQGRRTPPRGDDHRYNSRTSPQSGEGKTRKGPVMSLDSGNFNSGSNQSGTAYAARGGVNFNPYAATVNAYSLPSPGTQFYAQFAPSPMVSGNPAADAISPSRRGMYHPQGQSTVQNDEAAAAAAAQNAIHQHHVMSQQGFAYPHQMQQYGGFVPPMQPSAGLGYPQQFMPAAVGGQPQGFPQGIQLTPYPSTAPAPHAHAGFPHGYYPEIPQGYAYQPAGFYPQPTVNVGGMVIPPHNPEAYLPQQHAIPQDIGRGRGRGGDRGRGRGGRGGPTTAPQAPRSDLLERFRNSNGAGSWRLEDIEGYALEFARDQEGSRFIQKMLDSSPPAAVDRLFREIFSNPVELITDVFGNYVLQKLLEVGTHDQLLLVAESLQSQVVPLTLQTYGCRVIQKCIEVMPPKGLDIIIGELQGNVAKCIQDQNGNHVVQKCVEVVPERCGFIVSAFTGRVKELATHAYGCRVIQCILQHCPKHEQAIFEELLGDIVNLTEDQYGNYVVQHVLQHAKDEQAFAVFEKLKDHFYRFSVHKFASNVMERLFNRASESQRRYIIDSLVREVEIGCQKEECSDGIQRYPTQLFFMMKDQYANYVVQKVIDLCSDDHKRRLMISTQPYVPALRKFTFGKHMVARLERMKLLPVALEE